MGFSYVPLWVTLAERGLKKGDLREKAGLYGNTIAKMSKNQYVSMKVLDKICEALDVPIEKVMRYETVKE